jgi:hypothetical protein
LIPQKGSHAFKFQVAPYLVLADGLRLGREFEGLDGGCVNISLGVVIAATAENK